MFATLAGWQVGEHEVEVEGGHEVSGHITPLSSSTLGSNLDAEWTHGWSFHTVFAFVFPCFIGIMTGACRCACCPSLPPGHA